MNAIPGYFTRLEWKGFWITTLIAFGVYLFTLAPNVTLEDSGEFVTAAYHWGVPHPPGYPIWTISANLFSHLVPFGNVAWKVNMMSAFYGAMASGMLCLITSKLAWRVQDLGFMQGFSIRNISREALALMSGVVGGLVFAFIDTMWSQAVITEVYTMNSFFFTALCLLVLRWFDAPGQWRWPCLIALMFGLGITNHQTLMVSAPAFLFAMYVADIALYANVAPIAGVACCILAWKGKFWFLWLFGGFYLLHYAYLMAIHRNLWSARNVLCGIFSLALGCFVPALFTGGDIQLGWFFLSGAMAFLWVILCVYHVVMASGVIRASAPFFLSFFMFVAGSSCYLYMPLSATTNPPMNWGHTSNLDGFKHHILRGQYEPIRTSRPVEVLLRQYRGFFEDLDDNFSLPLLLLGVATLFLSFEFRKKEQDYLGFTVLCLFMMGFFLVYLLNPRFDEQSVFINRVFYGLAHGVFALWIGLGTIFMLGLVKKVEKRDWFLYAALLLIALAAAGYWQERTWWARILSLGMASFYLYLVSCLLSAQRNPKVLLAMVYALPLIPLSMNWSGSEMRGHDFGLRYGYEMFRNIDKNAILYGGTDPGRFVPTHMIFVESMQPKKWRKDPNFDRSDVYIITQNALADFTYMDYIRDHYSIQRPTMDRWYHRIFGREKTYPKDPIYLPNTEEFNGIFAKVIEDNRHNPDSGIIFTPEPNGQGAKAAVQGVQGVFMVNAAVAQWIFNRNKDKHTFYVEESYPLDWMYPMLLPDGLIMKIAREPLAAIPPQVVARDMDYWSRLVADLMSNKAFLRDVVARKSFSKLRSSIGGLYGWRAMYSEAEKAFNQAVELYPGNGEARSRLIDIYLIGKRYDLALEQCHQWLDVDPNNHAPVDSMMRVEEIKSLAEKDAEMERLYPASRNDPVFIFQYAHVLRAMNKMGTLNKMIDEFLNRPGFDIKAWQTAIQFYAQSNNPKRMEELLQRLCSRDPKNALAWLNLAAVQAALEKNTECIANLRRAVQLNGELKKVISTDERFAHLKALPEFQKILQ